MTKFLTLVVLRLWRNTHESVLRLVLLAASRLSYLVVALCSKLKAKVQKEGLKMFRVQYQSGGNGNVEVFLQAGNSGGFATIVVYGQRAVVQVPPCRALVEEARSNWHDISRNVKALLQNENITEVLLGEQ